MITKACHILIIHIPVKKVQVFEANGIPVRNIQAYMERVVTKFGSGTKVDRPKKFLGKKAYPIIEKDDE